MNVPSNMPFEPLRTIYFVHYINSLSDFLFKEKYLDENDQHKHIPIVNAFYNYLDNTNDNNLLPDYESRKIHLAKNLENTTDYYEVNGTQIYYVDLVNTTLKSLVFEKFGGPFGFILETLSKENDDTYKYVMQRLKRSLFGLIFDNGDGKQSVLTSRAIDWIFKDFIEEFFPKAKNSSVRITSLNYIYAQAGKRFFKSVNPRLKHIVFKNVGEDDNDDDLDEDDNFNYIDIDKVNDENNFKKYIKIARRIQPLYVPKKFDELGLLIFTVPAYINYVYNEKESLQSYKNFTTILNSQDVCTKAFQNLFLEIEKQRSEDTRNKFSLAISSIKNRTAFARETIENNCSTQNKIDKEVKKYKDHPKRYRCKNGKSLGNLNLNYQEYLLNITKKYKKYEKEMCREAFGKSFIDMMNSQDIIISKAYNSQQLRESDDLFKVHLLENKTSLYFALIRNNYNVTLIEEGTNPALFRQKLGLDDDIAMETEELSWMKLNSKNFERFLSTLAQERVAIFWSDLKDWARANDSSVKFYSKDDFIWE
ncbi:uncharacterized protein LOC122512625 [Leptopilina heterotoma]|uniref:uncharacterized protein LOC122512625 n=1 Tax=Leptopilina heterotoma TaxID=63436 RepID=UPI001CA8F14A|nr:uncharacterized protein LOC122512625 [Leptopilina heterotoma]